MSNIQGFVGLAEEQWPRELITTSIEPYLSGRITIPHTVEGIAERIYVETYRHKGTDITRQLGIFDALKPEQVPVSIKFYGFIKYVSIAGYGNWNGSRMTASKACLRLELDGRGCTDAFNPQLNLVESIRSHVSELLEAEDTGEQSSTLRFQHVLFRKVPDQEHLQPPPMTRGEDPTGKLARIAREWRLNPRPTLYKRNESGAIMQTTARSFAVNDFVQVTGHPDLIYRDGRGRLTNRARIVLTIESMTRLHSHQELRAMQIPVLLERQMLQRSAVEAEGDVDVR